MDCAVHCFRTNKIIEKKEKSIAVGCWNREQWRLFALFILFYNWKMNIINDMVEKFNQVQVRRIVGRKQFNFHTKWDRQNLSWLVVGDNARAAKKIPINPKNDEQCGIFVREYGREIFVAIAISAISYHLFVIIFSFLRHSYKIFTIVSLRVKSAKTKSRLHDALCIRRCGKICDFDVEWDHNWSQFCRLRGIIAHFAGPENATA